MKALLTALCFALPFVSQAEMLMEYSISSPLYGPYVAEVLTIDTNGEVTYLSKKDLTGNETTEVIAQLPDATVANLTKKIEALDGTAPLVTSTKPAPRAHISISMTVKKAGQNFVIMRNTNGTEYRLEYGVGRHLESVLEGLFVLARKAN